MKILVFSDTHGSTNGMDYALAANPDTDYMVHCGDVTEDAQYLQMVYPHIPLYYVRGNNDFSLSTPSHLILNPMGEYRFYITHGHLEGVKRGYDRLINKCRQNNCTIALFGHTHIPVNFEMNGIHLVNPGSGRKSYSIITLKDTIDILNRLI